MHLTDHAWATYLDQGYLRLGRCFDRAALGDLQERIDAIMLGTADIAYDRLLMQVDSSTGAYHEAGAQTLGHKGATLAYRKIQNLEEDPRFFAAMRLPLFAAICRRVYGDRDIACYRAMFMNKPASRGTVLPMHQDRWTSLDRDPLVTIWIALDPATIANGCVEVVPGSHRRLLNPGHPSGFLTPDMEAEHAPKERRIPLELEPGEAVLLHNWLLHGSDVNRSGQSRRAFSVCYMDADTRVVKTGERASSTVVFPATCAAI